MVLVGENVTKRRRLMNNPLIESEDNHQEILEQEKQKVLSDLESNMELDDNGEEDPNERESIFRSR